MARSNQSAGSASDGDDEAASHTSSSRRATKKQVFHQGQPYIVQYYFPSSLPDSMLGESLQRRKRRRRAKGGRSNSPNSSSTLLEDSESSSDDGGRPARKKRNATSAKGVGLPEVMALMRELISKVDDARTLANKGTALDDRREEQLQSVGEDEAIIENGTGKGENGAANAGDDASPPQGINRGDPRSLINPRVSSENVEAVFHQSVGRLDDEDLEQKDDEEDEKDEKEEEEEEEEVEEDDDDEGEVEAEDEDEREDEEEEEEDEPAKAVAQTKGNKLQKAPLRPKATARVTSTSSAPLTATGRKSNAGTFEYKDDAPGKPIGADRDPVDNEDAIIVGTRTRKSPKRFGSWSKEGGRKVRGESMASSSTSRVDVASRGGRTPLLMQINPDVAPASKPAAEPKSTSKKARNVQTNQARRADAQPKLDHSSQQIYRGIMSCIDAWTVRHGPGSQMSAHQIRDDLETPKFARWMPLEYRPDQIAEYLEEMDDGGAVKVSWDSKNEVMLAKKA